MHVIGCIVLNDFSRCMNLVSWECFCTLSFCLIYQSCYCGDDSETWELSWEGNMWETIELVLLKHEWPHFPTHNVLCSNAWKVQLFFAKLWSIVQKKSKRKRQKNLGWSSGVFQSCERITDDWWDWTSIDVTTVFWLTWSVSRFFSQNKRVEFSSPRNSRGYQHGCRSVV